MQTRSTTCLPLRPGHYYHIYNRANGSHPLFYNQEHYLFFLQRLGKYAHGYFDTFAYCLISNHFHLLIRPKKLEAIISAAQKDYGIPPQRLNYSIRKFLANTSRDSNNSDFSLKDFSLISALDKDVADLVAAFLVSEQFRRMFMSYSKAINRQLGRKGSLFQKYFRRKSIESADHLRWLIWYIHRNPLHHQVTDDFHNYLWSSYRSLVSNQPTRLAREEVLNWFKDENIPEFVEYHKERKADWEAIKALTLE